MVNNHLEFYLADTGIGIAQDDQAIIFERFAQLNPGVNKLVSGTGLGLAIVKGLVELLGGELTLQSEKDKGSKFTFTIAFKKIEQSTLTDEKPINIIKFTAIEVIL